MSYYDYFRKKVRQLDVKKIVDEFFDECGKEIEENIKGIIESCREEYETSFCNEHIVSGEMARDIVQPLYDFVEKIKNEIRNRIFMLFLEKEAGEK